MKPENREFVGRADSGSTTVMKLSSMFDFILTTTDPNRLKQTVQDSESDQQKPLIVSLSIADILY